MTFMRLASFSFSVIPTSAFYKPQTTKREKGFAKWRETSMRLDELRLSTKKI